MKRSFLSWNGLLPEGIRQHEHESRLLDCGSRVFLVCGGLFSDAS